MSFKLLNNVITKDDITPLSRNKNNKGNKGRTSSSGNNEDGVEEEEPVIIDSIPTDTKIDSQDQSFSEDNDGLFSPLSEGLHDDNDYDDYYSDEPTRLEKFQSFQLSNNHHMNSILKNNKNLRVPARLHNNDFQLGELSLPSPLSDNNDDFWKEVTITNEEAISSLPSTYDGDSPITNNVSRNIDQKQENVSVEDFISDDFVTDNNSSTTEWNEKIFEDSNYRVKLLCYRDAEGKFALKTRNVPVSSSTSNSLFNKSNRLFTSATGLVRKRKNKNRKLLKKGIRRKSGVGQMISTNVGISELML